VTSKKKSEKSTHLFLVDTNLFIASIKNPKKETTSLKLLLELIENAAIELIGNEFLIMEMEKYSQVFESERGKEILQKLIDVYHAASCLQKRAILITNDRHFNKINDEKIIEVWSISKAIDEFGI
jgi:predicted nucleic acid-binding protein